MARITHVKSAQQRYETVPVLDPETGQPKRTPVMRNGAQRTTKGGRPIFMAVTVADKSQPLPPRRCDSCRQDIAIGTPYKHMSPKSGPYGGRMLTRHEDCPTWQVWEYSSSLSARTAQIEHDYTSDLSAFESADDVTSHLSEAAEAIRDLANEKEEGADNMESGFGHETEQSSELRETAEQLNSWADDVENADVPDYPEPEEADCEKCSGTGTLSSGDDEVDCEECNGSGQVTPDEPTEEQIDEWRSEVEEVVSSVLGECPV